MFSTDRVTAAALRRAARPAPALLAALLLAGCADKTAGQLPVDGQVGLATTYNIRVHAGGQPAADRLLALVADFRASAPHTVTFAFDSAKLDAEARAALDRQAEWLSAHPGALVRLYGHADLVGTERYNDRLGLRRARAAAAHLVDAGVERGRIRLIESRGEREPVIPVQTREERNRRVVTAVEGYGAAWAGGGFDGKRALLTYTEYTQDAGEEAEAEAAGE